MYPQNKFNLSEKSFGIVIIYIGIIGDGARKTLPWHRQ